MTPDWSKACIGGLSPDDITGERRPLETFSLCLTSPGQVDRSASRSSSLRLVRVHLSIDVQVTNLREGKQERYEMLLRRFQVYRTFLVTQERENHNSVLAAETAHN